MKQYNGNYWTKNGKKIAWTQNWFDELFESNRSAFIAAMQKRIELKNDPDAVTYNYGGRVHAESQRLDNYYNVDHVDLDELEQALDEIESRELEE